MIAWATSGVPQSRSERRVAEVSAVNAVFDRNRVNAPIQTS